MNPTSSPADVMLRELISNDGINELVAILLAVVVSMLVNRLMRGSLSSVCANGAEAARSPKVPSSSRRFWSLQYSSPWPSD
jgi:hypothetical protein